MKTLLATAAAIALTAGAGAASAQMYGPMPAPAYQTYQMEGPVQPMQRATTVSGTPSWAQDDGSSSDYPIHNPGDFSADRLNAQYQGGIPTTPGHGFPAYPGVYIQER